MEKRIDEKALEWEQFDKIAGKIKINLRPLLLAIRFESQPSSDFLKTSIEKFKRQLKKGSLVHMDHNIFGPATRKYLACRGEIIPSRYEFQLYRTIADKLISGDLFVADSLSYRSFDQDLIDGESWKEKDCLVASLNLPKLQTNPQKLLKDLEEEFDSLYKRVQKRVLNGKNTHVKFSVKENKKWTLPYPKLEESPSIDVFGSIPPVRISSLLTLVNKQCLFTESFRSGSLP